MGDPWKDWVGGYPFEVATPAAVTEFCNTRGLEPAAAKTTTSAACNEFVFRRGAAQ
jgi:2-polyprenyl-6-hydroxyphenyl methylase/3-demethylubiquinone-9 3-methyltransferase